ncbi:MAG: RHS repeat domain-containing protein [Bacteroidota bacterium]
MKQLLMIFIDQFFQKVPYPFLKLAALAFIPIFPFHGFAQQEDVIPPSPTPAALAQYGNTPVDLYHGLPNISIPLYNIQVDDVSVPISLSFHASGHKVGTVASWVGLGWSLNAGGVVTRSVRGLPDEHNHGYFSTMESILEWKEQGIIDKLMEDSSPPFLAMKNQMYLIHLNNWDTQSDIFYYNYPGGAGKFTFDIDQNILQFPYQDLSISPKSSSISNGFEIVDLEGVAYTFDESELSSVNYSTPTDERVFESTWYLSEIESRRSKKVVHFEYDYRTLIVEDNFPTHSVTERLVSSDSDYSRTENEASRVTTVNTRHLSKIAWEAGYVLFYASKSREDLQNGYKLDSLAVFNLVDERLKSFAFDYREFSSGLQPWEQHLILESIVEIGMDGKMHPPYEFTYYGLGDLPSRNSYASDHFGYFNRATSNRTLVPSFTSLMGPIVPGADREPNPSTTGMIKELHYPTGGHTSFYYEGHGFYPVGGLPESIIATGSTAAMAESCEESGVLFRDQGGFGIEGLVCEEESESVISIPSNAFNLNLEVMPFYSPDATIEHNGDKVYSAEVYLLSNGSEELIGAYQGYLMPYSNREILEPGKEYKIVSRTNIQGSRLRLGITYQYQKITQPEDVQQSVSGGLRIKRVDHHNGSELAKSLTYEYYKFNEPNKSSGVILAREPYYDYEFRALEQISSVSEGSPATIKAVDYRTHSAAPSGVLGAFESDHIGYEEVIEREVGNGFTHYRYSIEPDDLVFGLQAMPDFPPTKLNLKQISSGFWKRGLLLEKQVFDENSQRLVYEKNHYDFVEINTSIDFHYELKVDKGGAGLPEDNGYAFVFAGQVSGWPKLSWSEHSTIEDNVPLTIKRTYGYQEANSSPELTLPVHITYEMDGANDYSESRVYLNNRGDHVISPIIEVVKERGGYTFEKVSNTYSEYQIESTQVSYGTNVFREARFGEYNGAKPSYIKPHTGISSVNLWGYNKTLPVAQITNLTYAEVASLLGDDIELLEASSDTNHIRNVLLSLQARLPLEAQMTIYLYRPGIGVVETIDPNGRSTTYEYDGFQRLTKVIDHDGYTLQQFQYHYANQND